MDRGQKDTEARLKEVERRINKEYAQAIDDIEVQLTDYFRRFEIKDKKWQEWVESGYKTEEQYKQWRTQQMAVGQKWNDQKEQIAYELAHVNETAKDITKSAAPSIFAENANYATWQVEKDAKVDTSFTLYSRDSVARLIADDPEVLPPVGKKVSQEIAMGKAVKWNKQQLQSVMIQGILQGDSIPKLATRLANTVGDRDRKASIRNARTMATAAQNAGRVNAYKRAEDKGIDLEQMWIATLDGRTRHSHRWLDGEIRPVGEEFSNGCEYPADPKGDPAEIYNCRCTLRGVVKGLERRSGLTRVTDEGQSYDEWRNGKAKSNPIELPEKKGEAIKQSYLNEYRRNGKISRESTLNKDTLSRAKNINSIEDVRAVSNSPVIEMKEYSEVQKYFAQAYNIAVEGFDKKDILAINATMAGYDDMLSEFPETQGILKRIVYNAHLSDYGNWDSAGKSEVSPIGLMDYGTGVHEVAHVLDYVRGYNYTYSSEVIEQARKNLHYRANGKDYKDEWTRICGMPAGIKQKDREKFAYAIETAKGGGSSALAKEIYRIAKEGK